jgi:hypothetical protein
MCHIFAIKQGVYLLAIKDFAIIVALYMVLIIAAHIKTLVEKNNARRKLCDGRYLI